MTRALEAPRRTASQPAVPYSLSDTNLPFALQFALRRNASEAATLPTRGTSSDGQTSGSDGSGGDAEEFDWLDDD